MRTTTRLGTVAAAGALLVLAVGATNTPAKDNRFESEVFLVNCGTIAGSAKRRVRVEPDRTDLRIEIQDVPTGAYSVLVDGVDRGTIVVGSFAEGQIEFDTRPGPGELPLTFDPFGEIDIVRDSTGLLAFSLTADAQCTNPVPPPAGGCTFFENEVFLVSCGTVSGTAKRRVRVRDDCDQDLRIELQNVPLGNYSVLVGGVFQGTIAVTGVEGQIEFDTTPAAGEELLDFDPFGEIDIVQDSTGLRAFTLTADATCTGGGAPPGGACTPIEDEDFLVNCGVSGRAKRRVRVRDDCDKDLRIEIERAVNGSYTVYVDGISRGVIDVQGRRGQIEFDTTPAAGEHLLNFDPFGEVDIVRSATNAIAFSLSAGCTVP
jgi:hypothetical protein